MRKIIHLDMNAFFASVEQQVNPALRGKPIAVCGRGRTVVTTASYEARRYGVKTGMSIYEARSFCPGIIAVEGDYARYSSAALEMHKICLEYTGFVEVFSIDEVFMDITDTPRRFGDAVNIARRIKEKLKRRTGLTCSVGIAPGKLLAKLASEREKPDGLVEFTPGDIPEVLAHTPVEDLCGIGPRTASRLNQIGINTLLELSRADDGLLLRNFGFLGGILKKNGRGEDTSKVARYSDSAPVKSVGHSNTFPKDTLDPEVVRSFLFMLSEKAGFRMRKHSMIGSTVSLYIRYCDFTGFSRQRRVPGTVKTGREIYSAACFLLDKIIPFQKPVRLAGVSISNLVKDRNQGQLLEEDRRGIKLTEAADLVNAKHGEMTLRPLSFDIALGFSENSIDIPARVHGFQGGPRRRV